MTESPFEWISQLRKKILSHPIRTHHLAQRMKERSIRFDEVLRAIRHGFARVEASAVVFIDVTDPFNRVAVVVTKSGVLKTTWREGLRS